MVGTIRYLEPGDTVWDYSFDRPTARQLQDANVKGVSRYIARLNNLTQGKIVILDEVKWLADLGILVQINLETNDNDPTKGAARGHQDAQLIEQYRTGGVLGPALDFPLDLPIVCSLDVGVSSAVLNGPVTDYFAAVATDYSGLIGDYHGVVLHRRLKALGYTSLCWTPANAWSWSLPYKVDAEPTDMVQQLSGISGTNDILPGHRVPFWDYYGTLQPTENDLTDEQIADLFKKLDELLAVNTLAANDDGSYVFNDPFGKPMRTSWQVGWVMELAKQIPKQLSDADIDRLANAVVAKLPTNPTVSVNELVTALIATVKEKL